MNTPYKPHNCACPTASQQPTASQPTQAAYHHHLLLLVWYALLSIQKTTSAHVQLRLLYFSLQCKKLKCSGVREQNKVEVYGVCNSFFIPPYSWALCGTLGYLSVCLSICLSVCLLMGSWIFAAAHFVVRIFFLLLFK